MTTREHLNRARCALLLISTVLASAALLGGCETIKPEPFRVEKNEKNVSCSAAGFDAGCGDMMTPEIWNLRVGGSFKLHFVEFDDQGWLYDGAKDQIDWIMKDLRHLYDPKKQLRIVVFVHGWKHNAQMRDGNLQKFRHMLAQLRGVDVALNRSAQRELVGIYVGWRGKSWQAEPGTPQSFLLNTTFWTRKSTAMRVAQGQARELFGRLRAFQADANSQDRRGCARDESESASEIRCSVRMAIIGHSFGGLIVEAALAETLIDILSDERDPKIPSAVSSAGPESDKGKVVRERRTRFADSIILINPAFEASRYTPIHRLASALELNNYHPPLLISITSTGDDATGLAFPLGRAINSAFEKDVGPLQKRAITNTPGHIPEYYTHELVYDAADEPLCTKQGWQELYDFDEQSKVLELKPVYSENEPLLRSQIVKNAQAEDDLREGFFGDKGGLQKPSLKEPWERSFCGGLKLKQFDGYVPMEQVKVPIENKHPNTPVWNIRTSGPIIYNHNDFMTPQFINFVRQLYRDGELME